MVCFDFLNFSENPNDGEQGEGDGEDDESVGPKLIGSLRKALRISPRHRLHAQNSTYGQWGALGGVNTADI